MVFGKVPARKSGTPDTKKTPPASPQKAVTPEPPKNLEGPCCVCKDGIVTDTCPKCKKFVHEWHKNEWYSFYSFSNFLAVRSHQKKPHCFHQSKKKKKKKE